MPPPPKTILISFILLPILLTVISPKTDLPMAIALAKADYEVSFFDPREKRLATAPANGLSAAPDFAARLQNLDA